jgi:hypothetical protein
MVRQIPGACAVGGTKYPCSTLMAPCVGPSDTLRLPKIPKSGGPPPPNAWGIRDRNRFPNLCPNIKAFWSGDQAYNPRLPTDEILDCIIRISIAELM